MQVVQSVSGVVAAGVGELLSGERGEVQAWAADFVQCRLRKGGAAAAEGAIPAKLRIYNDRVYSQIG